MNAINQEPTLALQTVASTVDRITTLRPGFGVSLPFPAAGSLAEARSAQLIPEGDLAPAPSSRGDTFQLYLREIGQVKLLTPEEEVVLAERIEKGDEEAREQMIKANLRLVVKIARHYVGLGLPLMDLISEGNIGLIKGVERFRPDKGAKLSTYAAVWIKQSIKHALAIQSKIIRLPTHVTRKVAEIRRAEIKLRDTLDREATDKEIADDVELSPRRLKRYREASHEVVSLDSAVSNKDLSPISECIADENATAPFDELVKDNDNDLLYEVLGILDPRESKILTMRFGLDDGRAKTLDEVGEHFGISRERICQIQERALKKTRAMIEKRSKPRTSTQMACRSSASAKSKRIELIVATANR